MKATERIRDYLLNRSDYFIPSWIILLKDLLIVLFSFSFSYTLRYNFQVPDEVLKHMYFQFLPVAIISILIFISFGIHRSVIRHTGIRDAITIVEATFILTLCLFLMYFLFHANFLSNLFEISRSVIIIFFILSTTSILIFRSAIRLFYHWLKSGEKALRVLIYGAGSAGIITKDVLTSDHSKPVKVIGFVDNNPGKIGKTIEGTYVYSMGVLNPGFIKKNQVDEIIFSIQNINKQRKREILEELLQKTQILVKDVPPVEAWINGQLSARQINPIRITDLLQRSEIQLENAHVRAKIEGKSIMVTGAAGSIGSELVRQICSFKPQKLIMVDQGETPMFNLENEINKLHCEATDLVFIVTNVEDHKMMKRVFEEHLPQIIYHAAAYKHVPVMEQNPFEAVRVNILGTKNIADLAAEFGVERFVMISTDKAVNPTNVMGATKRAAEIYIQSLNNHLKALPHVEGRITEFITTRFGNVLGSNGSVIPLFEKQIAAGGPVTVTHPDITRFFMTIPEACQLVLEAGALGNGGEILMFDMGKPVKIADLAYNMIRLSDMEPGKDIHIVYTGLRPGEKLYEELLYEKEKGYKTHHPKIFVGKQKPYQYEDVNRHVSVMRELISNQIMHSKIPYHLIEEKMNLVKKLKELMPEYVSNNSIYQRLDVPA